MKIKVGVMGTNAQGKAEVAFYDVDGTEDDIALGGHLQQAKERFFEEGKVPQIAFDKHDPAWSAFSGVAPVGAVYREITYKVMEELQDCLIPDRDVNGADLVDKVQHLLQGILTEDLPAAGEPNDLFVIHGPGGYWRDGGLVEEITVTMNPKTAADLGSSPLYTVAKCSQDLLELAGAPAETDLVDAAEAAFERAGKHGFSITEENAAEVMREELALAGLDDMPSEFNAIFEQAIALARENQSQHPRQRG